MMKNWKRQMYKPITKICLSNVADGWGRTTYSQSYKPPRPADRNSKPTMATIKGLWPSLDSEQFNRMTVHQASFREHSCADRTLPAVQRDHELVGGSQALMHNVTSQRHDFMAKCLPKAERQRANAPKGTIGTNCGSGEGAMTCSTTTADAFGIPCSNGRRPLARPSTSNWSQGKKLLMAKDTETSTRYKQWGPMDLSRSRPPATDLRLMAAYFQPEEPVNSRTEYIDSYLPPYPLYGNDEKSAVDEADTSQPFNPRAHDYNLCRLL